MFKEGLLLSIALACLTMHAQEQITLSRVSPKLKRFLIAKPDAYCVLTNAITEAFSNRTFRLFYFYSDTETEARAFHYYPSVGGLADVVICVRENQLPLDEFLCFVFEVANTCGQKQFELLAKKAVAGKISRTGFATEILRVEFEAIRKTQALLARIKFTNEETSNSYYYGRIAGCPSKFEDFVAYTKRSQQRDVIKEYESRYDGLRKTSKDRHSTVR